MPIDFPVTKYADPSYTDVAPTDDDKVMLRTAAGTDARASLVQPKGYIDGLRMVWVSSSQVRILSGCAYVPSVKRIVELSSGATKSVPSAPNTWYHLYLFVSSGVADFEVSTTTPSSPYYGTARTKSGDASRRYLGSVRTSGSGDVYKFKQSSPDTILYLVDTSVAPFSLVIAGAATVPTTVNASVIAPITSDSISLVVLNFGTAGAFVRLSNSEGPSVSTGFLAVASPGGVTALNLALDASQSYTYQYDSAPAGNNSYHRANGYTYSK